MDSTKRHAPLNSRYFLYFYVSSLYILLMQGSELLHSADVLFLVLVPCGRYGHHSTTSTWPGYAGKWSLGTTEEAEQQIQFRAEGNRKKSGKISSSTLSTPIVCMRNPQPKLVTTLIVTSKVRMDATYSSERSTTQYTSANNPTSHGLILVYGIPPM